MKRLTLLAFAPLCLSVSSCGLAGRVIQTPIRLIQAGARTVSDVDETTTPATAESTRSHGLALKASTLVSSGR